VAPGGEGLGWGVEVSGPGAKLGEDLFDDRGLLNGQALLAEPESQCIAKVTKVATSRLKTSRLKGGNVPPHRLTNEDREYFEVPLEHRVQLRLDGNLTRT